MKFLLRDIRNLSCEVGEKDYNIGTLARWTYVKGMTLEGLLEIAKANNIIPQKVKNGDVFVVLNGDRVYRLSEKWSTFRSGVYGSCSWFLDNREAVSKQSVAYCKFSDFRINHNYNSFCELETSGVKDQETTGIDNLTFLMNTMDKQPEKVRNTFNESLEKANMYGTEIHK